MKMESNLILKWNNLKFFTTLTKIKYFENPKNWSHNQIESSIKQ